MPKMKSHSGAKRRIRFTGGGKLVRLQANMSHRRLKKSGSRKRRLKVMDEVSKSDAGRITRLISK